MAKTVKAAKKSSKKQPANAAVEVPALLGLALLLGLLCLLPWVSGINGSDSLKALQLALAFVLALAGGFCLGLQVAATRKK